MANAALAIMIVLRAREGREADLKHELLTLQARTLGEPGCLRFDLHQKADDPARFLAYQHWASTTAFKAHNDNPWWEFRERSHGLLEGQPIVLKLNILEAGTNALTQKGNTMEHADVDTIIKCLHRIADPLEAIKAILGGKAPAGGPSWTNVPSQATSGSQFEEVLVRYTVGTGTFSKDKRYSALNSKMYKMNGDEDGTFEGVWEPQLLPPGWYDRPDKPHPPYNVPVGPCPPVAPRAYTKAVWTFGDPEKSSVTGVGPAFLHLVPQPDGQTIFLVSVAGVITNGTGKYKHAYGVKTALGATLPPKGVDLFNLQDGDTFPAVTVETFRIIPRTGHQP